MLIGLPRMIYAADVVVPPAPCHPNPNAATDGATAMNRGDIKNLPDPLKDRLGALAKRPHSILPVRICRGWPSERSQYPRSQSIVSILLVEREGLRAECVHKP